MTSEYVEDPELTRPLETEPAPPLPARRASASAATAARSGAPRESLLALPPGHRLQEFVVESTIGEGGFGIVYLARDTRLNRAVAIKEFLPAAFASRTHEFAVSVRSDKHRGSFEAGRRSFINEARLLAQFDHPALVKVYRYWEENGTAYIVMPYYAGQTMKEWVHALPGRVPEQRLLRVVDALCDPLQMLHAQGVFHRDIAPDNIRIQPGDQPVLLDLGAARQVMADMSQTLTVFFKAGYAPIEQYAEVATLRQGPWTDVYALSAVLYYCVTGHAPPPSAARMVADEMVAAAVAGAGRYSAGFLEAIDRGLAIRPEQRTRTIADLRSGLGIRQPAAGPARADRSRRPPAAGASSPASGSEPTPGNSGYGPVRRSPRIKAGHLAIGLALCATLLFAAGRWKTEQAARERARAAAAGAAAQQRAAAAAEAAQPALQAIGAAQARIAHVKDVLAGTPEAPKTLFETAEAALDDARVKSGSGQVQAAVGIAQAAAGDAERTARDFLLEREIAYRQAADQSLKRGDIAAAEAAVGLARQFRARGAQL